MIYVLTFEEQDEPSEIRGVSKDPEKLKEIAPKTLWWKAMDEDTYYAEAGSFAGWRIVKTTEY